MTIRFVALGDSFTEGVGDPDPARPNGVRGWADRLAELLAQRETVAYANLAIRGRKLGQVVEQQVDAAVALKPTLVSLYAGGNDILRPSIDIAALMVRYDDAVRRLADTGARVLLFTGFDTAQSALFSRTRPRTALYNDHVRRIASENGATVVDYWGFDEYNDPRMWDVDRLHMSTLGHENMARRVHTILRGGEFAPPTLDPLPSVGRARAMRDDAAWVRSHLVPWVGRRLTGRSSGDGLSPRHSSFVLPAPEHPDSGDVPAG